VDTFWVGRLGQKTFPFIIDSDTGETFIDEAVIESLTFNKLRSEDGTLAFTPTVYDGLGNVTEAGKLKAPFIEADQLEVDYAKITNISVTSADIATAAITDAKIQDGAVTNAKIGNAQITKAKIGSAQVDTLQIKGEAVTVLQAQNGASGTWAGDRTMLLHRITVSNTSNEWRNYFVSFGLFCAPGTVTSDRDLVPMDLQVRYNGGVVYFIKDTLTGFRSGGFVQAVGTGNHTIDLYLVIGRANNRPNRWSRGYLTALGCFR
jgi:hypothetical protein